MNANELHLVGIVKGGMYLRQKLLCTRSTCVLIALVLLIESISVALGGEVLSADKIWRAHIIKIKGEAQTTYVEDYAESHYGDAWDFNEGDSEDIDHINGAQEVRIVGGRLEFITTSNTALGWGDFDNDEVLSIEENIGGNWAREHNPWVIRLRLTQSSNVSHWYIRGRYLKHGRIKEIHKNFDVSGVSEQTVVIPMGWIDQPIVAIEIGTADPANKIAIDWVRIERPSAIRYFRKKITLPEEAIGGKVAFGTNGHYRLYLNGKLISDKGGAPPFQRRINVIENLQDYLQVGANVLAVEVEAYGTFSKITDPRDYFFLQGKILLESGESVSLNTDASWKGSYRAKAGWEDISYDDAAWKKVESLGGVEEAGFNGASFDGRGAFLEPPYMGCIGVDAVGSDFPFFDEEEGAAFSIKVLEAKAQTRGEVHYSVDDETGKQVSIGNAELSQSENPIRGEAIIGVKGLAPGPYHLRLEYVSNGKTLDRRNIEFIIVGKIQQRKIKGEYFDEGLNLIHRYTVDTVKDFEENLHMASDSSHDKQKKGKVQNKKGQVVDLIQKSPWISPRIIKSATGDYVETAAYKGAWLSFKYKIKNLYVPHLAEIEYPLGHDRNMDFVVAEGVPYTNLRNVEPSSGVQRSIGGVYTEKQPQRESERGVFRLLFWPNRHEGTITVVNGGRLKGLQRGAMASVKIYEIQDDLPAVDHMEIAGDTFFGPFSERIDRTIPRVFYAGDLGAKFPYLLVDGYFDGYYKAWYDTIANLIRYLRFRGQNTYFAGIYMYHGGWFPSARFQGDPATGADTYGEGWKGGAIELMAKMFEANGLNLVLGVEFFGSRGIRDLDVVSDAEVRNGKGTVRMVTKDGRQANGYGVYNFLLPAVRDEMLALAGEIADKYGSYPGVKGVTWLQMPLFTPTTGKQKWSQKYSGLETGYGDSTVLLFERETGITLPEFNGPERFHSRYDWLLKNASEDWVNWRSKKVYELDRKITDTLQAERPDWKIWKLVRTLPDRSFEEWDRGEINYEDIYRNQGIDPARYGDEDGPGLLPVLEWTGERYFRDTWGDETAARLVQKFNQTPDVGEIFRKDGVFLRMTFMLEKELYAKPGWPWERLRVVASPAPPDKEFVDAARQILDRLDPEAVIMGWSDGGHIMGHEQGIRDISRFLNRKERNYIH